MPAPAPFSESTKAIPKDDQQRCHHLEHIVRTAVNACNIRDFDIASSAWSHFSSEFKVEQIMMSTSTSSSPTSSNKSSSEPMNLQDLLSFQRAVATKDPGYRYEILELATVAMDNKSGKAEVLMNARAHGIPEGVVRPIVETFEFRRTKGRWECVKLRCMSGVDQG
ncbi:hypothetical protein DOTSEDRAFT_71592 [Dothistroma septosporum NZE10]|uniref:SnoaL-like domain-containing protein n=1 Tax=Dothistroma septosporum (strain NZE10 / CBS 128990) TaxID=675120 RepID=N1PN42_DOTSN|nr:hypothetical protein DOTSEDRAFT_71592 [Dothistroma septosporum NZE10]